MTRQITIERDFDATLAEVWELLSTSAGIESWWGPEGFVTRVHTMDVRPGGQWRYSMTATGPDQVQFMKNAGMPLTTESRAVFTEVVPQRRLGYRHLVDFVPNVKPYEVTEVVELREVGGRVRMTVTIDAMHDEHWTKMSQMGWEQQLGKLARVAKAA